MLNNIKGVITRRTMNYLDGTNPTINVGGSMLLVVDVSEADGSQFSRMTYPVTQH